MASRKIRCKLKNEYPQLYLREGVIPLYRPTSSERELNIHQRQDRVRKKIKVNPHFINDVGTENDRPPDFTTNSQYARVDIRQVLFGARMGIGKDGTIYSANFGACRCE